MSRRLAYASAHINWAIHMTPSAPVGEVIARSSLAALALMLLAGPEPATPPAAHALPEIAHDATPERHMPRAAAATPLPDVHPLGLACDGQPHDRQRRHAPAVPTLSRK